MKWNEIRRKYNRKYRPVIGDEVESDTNVYREKNEREKVK